MEMVLNDYLSTFEECENNLTEARDQFKNRMVNISNNDKSKSKVLVATAAMMTSSNYKHEESSSILDWWDQFATNSFPDDDCISTLRCSRQTYLHLVKKLTSQITQNGNNSGEIILSKDIPAEKQIALTLFTLGKKNEIEVIAEKFGIDCSLIYPVVHEVIYQICKNLLTVVIKMPDIEEAVNISKCFESYTKIPQIIGVMNNIHIPISKNDLPKPTIFLNSQKYHSFILQAVVDSKNCFTDISVRYPGCVLDSRVLEDSNIYKYWKQVIPPVSRNIHDVDIPFQIIGPISYPLLPWLLKGYKIPITDGELTLNKQINVTKNVVLNAVKRMRARFSILSEELELNFQVAPQLIAACCILHNICEMNNDALKEEWLVESETLLSKYPQPVKQHSKQVQIEPIAIKQRNIIQQYLERIGDKFEFIECNDNSMYANSIDSDMCDSKDV